ncbi:MAG: tyrosine--tRNA ligase [Clostridia bacterium]
MEDIYKVLKSRNLIKQIIFEEEFKDLSKNEKFAVYLGIDPTADSLHIGHFIPLMLMSFFQKCGHSPIIIVGGGTAVIGDPSGKTDMRKMLTREVLDNNVEKLKKQISKFLSFEGDNKAIILNNADWLLKLNYMEFITKYGVLFNVNRMLAADCYKSRLENGLTFFEMNYMLMQSYDFLYLYENYNCKVQIGGDDQWSNILSGGELIRKIHNGGSFCLTCPLLLNSQGLKMGKTVSGALWLDPNKTTPYEFYQYFRNIEDADVYNVLRMLTSLPMDEVNRLSSLDGSKINEAKKIAAYEITKLIHSEKIANECRITSLNLFEAGIDDENMPSITINESTNILELLIKCNITKSKSEGKLLISQNGIEIDDKKVTDFNLNVDKNCTLKKGKKVYIKINYEK